MLASLITLTPGTLTLGTSTDAEQGRRVLYVHGMYHPDANALRADLADLEQRMLTAIRARGLDG